MPLKLTVPSLLAQDEKAPISARAHLRSDKISPAEINDTLRHIMDSLGAITRAMRSQKYIEDADVIIYGPGGEVAVRLTSTGLQVGGLQVVGAQQSATPALTAFPVTGTADLTYDSVERDMINSLATAVNQLGTTVSAIRTVLSTHGLTA